MTGEGITSQALVFDQAADTWALAAPPAAIPTVQDEAWVAAWLTDEQAPGALVLPVAYGVVPADFITEFVDHPPT